MIRRIAIKKPFSTPQGACELRPLVGVEIKNSFAFGVVAGESYDPFVQYYQWKERRDSSLPVHLAFACLRGGNNIEAKEFLEKYGALLWRTPRLANAAQKRVRVDLTKFWAEQKCFVVLFKLYEAIRSRRGAQEIMALLLHYVAYPGERPVTRYLSLTPWLFDELGRILGIKTTSIPKRKRSLKELLETEMETAQREGFTQVQPLFSTGLRKEFASKVKSLEPNRLVQCAAELVARGTNTALARAGPMLRADFSEGRESLDPSWRCRTVREAIYTMLFLDIEHGRRIVRCDGCGTLFADAKENVRFCSLVCETRTRARNWWRKHGKKYRAKQRRRKQGGKLREGAQNRA